MTLWTPAPQPPPAHHPAALSYCHDLEQQLAAIAAEALAPEPELTVSEWADTYRWLTTESSSEAGKWRTDRFPFLKEPMDACSPNSPYEFVVMRFASQLGKTEVLLNTLFTYIDIAPCPILFVMPNEQVMKRVVRTRIHPALLNTPRLFAKIPVGGKVAGQEVLSKVFPGGNLDMGSARSPSKLSAMPVRLALGDEVDRWPHSAGGEGDPIAMLTKRTENFYNRKVILISSPSIAGSSRIDQEMLSTDDRRFLVPCPHCGQAQELVFSPEFAADGVKPHGRLVWEEGQPSTAKYQCAFCERLIDHKHKSEMLAAGVWKASREHENAKRIGFHLSGLYTPAGFKQDWAEIARKFLNARESKRAEDLQVFVNTALSESWQERGQAPDYDRLHERSEAYPIGQVPEGPLVLTAGVDVQSDRLEYEVVGWAENNESWSIEYGTIPGDPFDATGACFIELERRISPMQRAFPQTSGRGDLRLSAAAIDTGYATHAVYNWIRRVPFHCVAVKGALNLGAAIGKPSMVDVEWNGRVAKNSMQLWRIDDAKLKSELYAFLKRPLPNEDHPEVPGACHFPGYPLDYFKQLTAEALVSKRDRRGFLRQEWIKLRERNEALDCRKYARAAFLQAGFDRWTKERWAKLRANIYGDGSPLLQQPAAAPKIRIHQPYS